MPLDLDSCIAGVFTPGNIGASSGQTPVERTMPSSTPTITSSASVSVDEEGPLAHSLIASVFTGWSIVGGADQAQFEISGSTLRWISDGSQDFEAPVDADTNNIYLVTVRATTPWFSTVDQNISVTVNNIVEPVRQTMSLEAFVNMTGNGQIMIPGAMMDESR